MYVLIIVLGAVALIFFLRRKEEEQRGDRALRFYSPPLDWIGETTCVGWRFDLLEMRALSTFSDAGSEDREAEYLLGRKDGMWQIGGAGEDGGVEWQPVEDGMAGPLEVQYQRFLRHYRD